MTEAAINVVIQKRSEISASVETIITGELIESLHSAALTKNSRGEIVFSSHVRKADVVITSGLWNNKMSWEVNCRGVVCVCVCLLKSYGSWRLVVMLNFFFFSFVYFFGCVHLGWWRGVRLLRYPWVSKEAPSEVARGGGIVEVGWGGGGERWERASTCAGRDGAFACPPWSRGPTLRSRRPRSDTRSPRGQSGSSHPHPSLCPKSWQQAVKKKENMKHMKKLSVFIHKPHINLNIYQ